jgi:hypothetical protein
MCGILCTCTVAFSAGSRWPKLAPAFGAARPGPGYLFFHGRIFFNFNHILNHQPIVGPMAVFRPQASYGMRNKLSQGLYCSGLSCAALQSPWALMKLIIDGSTMDTIDKTKSAPQASLTFYKRLELTLGLVVCYLTVVQYTDKFFSPSQGSEGIVSGWLGHSSHPSPLPSRDIVFHNNPSDRGPAATEE